MAERNLRLVPSLYWPDANLGPWQVNFRFVARHGRLEPVGVAIDWAPRRMVPQEPEGPEAGGEEWEHSPEPYAEDDPERPEPEPLGTALMRSVPVSRLAIEVARHVPWLAEVNAHTTYAFQERAGVPVPERVSLEPVPALDHRGRQSGGRPRLYGEEHFADVARIYNTAWSMNSPPTLAVAQHFGVSKSAASKWIARARQLDFLPPTSRGRAAGR